MSRQAIFFAILLVVFFASIYISGLRDGGAYGSRSSLKPWYASVGKWLAWISGVLLFVFLMDDDVRPYLGWTFLGSSIMAIATDKTDEKSSFRNFLCMSSIIVAFFSGCLFVLSLLFGPGSGDCHSQYDGRTVMRACD